MRRPSNNLSVGSLLAVAVGGYVLWANRFRIQQFLESQGFNTPWLTGTGGDAIQSGAAKISGSIESAFKGNESAATL